MRRSRIRRFMPGPLVLAMVLGALVVPPSLLASRQDGARTAGPAAIPAAAPSFSFTVGGDFNQTSATDATLSAIGGMGSAYTLAIGDLSYQPGQAESVWCDYVKQRVGASYPFELVSGDHEDHDGNPAQSEGDINEYRTCLPNRMAGMQGDYAKEYWFDYPSSAPLVRTIMISPGITLDGGTYRYKPGEARWDWLVGAIDGARAAGIPWVVVGMHKPCLSMGLIATCGAGSELYNLLVEKRVDLTFHGHDHTYQRTKQIAHASACASIDPEGAYKAACVADDGADDTYTKGRGPVSVVVGTGGGALFDIDAGDPQAGYFARHMGDNDASKKHGVLRFDVSPTAITGQYASGQAGAFSDTFTIAGTTVLGASPSVLSFAGQPTSTASAQKTVTVSNASGAPVAITSAAVAGGNAQDFLEASDACSGATLAPGASCNMAVSFLPTAAGLRSAQLVVTNAVSPLTVPLSGTGTPNALSFDPPTVAFDGQAPGGQSPPRTVTLTNRGDDPVTVGTVSVAGPGAADFTVTGCEGRTLEPDEQCSLSVTFHPTRTGLRTATLVVSSDQPGSPYAVALSGMGGGGAGGGGYWLVASDGGIFAFGDAAFHGSTGAIRLAKPIIGMAPTPTGNGYWLSASDGGIFAFGDARFLGSTGDIALAQPIVAMTPTPTGNGYWLLARDGGIFAFGDAGFFGSTGDLKLTQPIVAMAPTPTGGGYWLVAADGGIFAFGDAAFLGSTGHLKLVRPIVTMSATPTGNGYWLVASDGGIFAFGDAAFHGSTGAIRLVKPIVGMTATPSGQGYWLVASDGGIFAFGDAVFLGSTGAIKLNQPIVGLAVRP
ncbi:MAG: choice-of-anchor D domain-containing protein [Actinomycetota bacterium]